MQRSSTANFVAAPPRGASATLDYCTMPVPTADATTAAMPLDFFTMMPLADDEHDECLQSFVDGELCALADCDLNNPEQLQQQKLEDSKSSHNVFLSKGGRRNDSLLRDDAAKPTTNPPALKKLPVRSKAERRLSGEKRPYYHPDANEFGVYAPPSLLDDAPKLHKQAAASRNKLRRHSAHASTSSELAATTTPSAGMAAYHAFQRRAQSSSSDEAVEPGFFAEEGQPKKRKVSRRCSMPATLGIGSDDLVLENASQSRLYRDLTEFLEADDDDVTAASPVNVPTEDAAAAAAATAVAIEEVRRWDDARPVLRRASLPIMTTTSFQSIQQDLLAVGGGCSSSADDSTPSDDDDDLTAAFDIMNDPAFEPTPLLALPSDAPHHQTTHQQHDEHDELFEPVPIDSMQQLPEHDAESLSSIAAAVAIHPPPSDQPSLPSNDDALLDPSPPAPVVADPLRPQEEDAAAVVAPPPPPSERAQEAPTVDPTNLRSIMSKSRETAQQLQEWDRAAGLPKSHSQTMITTGRSRAQLMEGKILKKWDGSPLIAFVRQGGKDGKIVVQAGPKKKRNMPVKGGKNKSRTATATTKKKKGGRSANRRNSAPPCSIHIRGV